MNDLAAIEQLWHSHHARLLNYVRYHTSYDQAEDIVQVIYLKACEATWRGIGYRDHAGGWLFAIARNVITDTFRYQGRRQAPVEYDALEEWQAYEDTHADAMQHITVERVQLAVGKLNANQEDVMQLRLQGYTYDEIGEVMHTNGNAAKSTIMRANANLRVYLQDMAA